jgi:hypothetical protein
MKFYEYKHRPAVQTAGHVIAWLTPRHPCIEIPTAMLTEATEMEVNDWQRLFGMTLAEVEKAWVHFTLSDPRKEAGREPRAQ